MTYVIEFSTLPGEIWAVNTKSKRMTEKKVDKSSWAIGGMTIIGVGVGFIFLQTAPLVFVACILIGVGLGLVLAAIISRKN